MRFALIPISVMAWRANERAVVQSIARRAKNAWTVVILNGKQPTFEKRGAAVGLSLGSSGRPSRDRTAVSSYPLCFA